ncbi:MAG: glycosyltransferase family 2 protein [Bacteroidota bacterium]
MSVSIIMPAYNSADYIAEAINSVISQTYKDWELIICDDNSSDETVNIVKDFQDKDNRIKLIELKNNGGPAVARNHALKNTNNKFVAFLDSDDIWHPRKLEIQLDFMEKNGYAFTFTSYKRFSHNGTKDYNVIKVPDEITYRELLKNTIIGTLTVIIDRDQVGDFEMNHIRYRQDMALWCEIMKRGFSAYGLNEVLASYRVVNKYSILKRYKGAKGVWKVYRKIEKINFLKSIYYFVHYAMNAFLKRIKK